MVMVYPWYCLVLSSSSLFHCVFLRAVFQVDHAALSPMSFTAIYFEGRDFKPFVHSSVFTTNETLLQTKAFTQEQQPWAGGNGEWRAQRTALESCFSITTSRTLSSKKVGSEGHSVLGIRPRWEGKIPSMVSLPPHCASPPGLYDCAVRYSSCIRLLKLYVEWNEM